jgi:hypothetical protein
MMDRDALAIYVVKNAPSHLREHSFLKTAFEEKMKELGEGASYHKRLALDILTRAKELYAEYITTKMKKDAADLAFAYTSRDFAESDIFAKRLRPWAKALRQERFKCDEAPFEIIDKAADWIEEETETNRINWEERHGKRREEIEKEINRLASEHRIEIRAEAKYVPYQREDSEYVRRALLTPGTFLMKLTRESENMAGVTGLRQDTLVAYILVGLKPVRPRMWATQTDRETELPGGERLVRRWETVTFYAADLTYDEVRAMYNAIKGYVGGEGAKKKGRKARVAKADLELLDLVKERGGPPRKRGAKTKFWETVREEWNSKPDVKPYRTSRGLSNRYERLSERLKVSS